MQKGELTRCCRCSLKCENCKFHCVENDKVSSKFISQRRSFFEYRYQVVPVQRSVEGSKVTPSRCRTTRWFGEFRNISSCEFYRAIATTRRVTVLSVAAWRRSAVYQWEIITGCQLILSFAARGRSCRACWN